MAIVSARMASTCGAIHSRNASVLTTVSFMLPKLGHATTEASGFRRHTTAAGSSMLTSGRSPQASPARGASGRSLSRERIRRRRSGRAIAVGPETSARHRARALLLVRQSSHGASVIVSGLEGLRTTVDDAVDAAHRPGRDPDVGEQHRGDSGRPGCSVTVTVRTAFARTVATRPIQETGSASFGVLLPLRK